MRGKKMRELSRSFGAKYQNDLYMYSLKLQITERQNSKILITYDSMY